MATLNTYPDSISVEVAIQTRMVADLKAINDEVAAITAGSAVLVSSNDSTVGYLNGKLVAGYGTTLTEGSDGADETLTIATPQYDTIDIDAGAWVPCTTNPPETETVEIAAGDDRDCFAFDGGATEEQCNFKFAKPEGMSLTDTVKAMVEWSTKTGSTAGDTVEWGIALKAIRNDDALSGSFGTAQVISDTVLVNNGADMHVTGKTPAITIGGTLALGCEIQGKIYRNTDGTDNCAEDARGWKVIIQYKKTETVAAW